MIEMSRLRLGVLAVLFSLTGALSGCCGGAHSHKCDFTSWMSQQDAGSDAALACGTEVCMAGTVCCLKKIAPYASCIPPEDYAMDQCEMTTVQPSCTTPADCDAGQVCCLNETAFTIDCQSPAACPGNGQSGTYLACGTYLDCPNPTKGSCVPVPGTGDAGLLLYCTPAPPSP